MEKRRSHKRPKYNFSETEDSQEELPSIPNSTSLFKLAHIEGLNIKFVNALTLEDFFADLLPYQIIESPLLLPEMTRGKLLELTDQEIKSNYRDKYSFLKSLIDLVKKNPVESERDFCELSKQCSTDTFINKLLKECGFDDCPFYIKIKPYLQGIVSGDDVSSTADQAVLRDAVTVIINENKRENTLTASTHYGEAQIAGELLISAQNIRREDDHILFAIRAINTRLTFYKAKFSASYLQASYSTYPCREESFIWRYPPEDYLTPDLQQLQALDFANPQDRQQILSALDTIRRYLSAGEEE